MINRVSDNEYYDHRKLNMPTASDTTSGGERFSLDYQRADDKKEEDEKEKIAREGTDKSLSGNKARTVMQGGVKLELSGKEQEKENIPQKDGFTDLLQTVRSWIAAFLQSFKGLLNRIWNDPLPEEEVLSTEEIPVDETERLSEEYLEINELEDRPAGSGAVKEQEAAPERVEQLLSGRVNRDKEIQKYLRSGNLDQVISLLTDNGQRTMAKNSSLLTYYDRTGRLTSLNASDQERILYGDRHVKKL